MEIAIGLVSVSIAMLGIILAYIWRSNGRMHRDMMIALGQIQQGQKEIQQGQKEIAQMLLNQTRILERIEVKL